ncbi:MAG TPA: glycoside hydrolase family 88 protein [Chitinophagaceae bacterium]|nr:glycoside hydrolase family 88 protein [Chitinophagaceae bacterium]
MKKIICPVVISVLFLFKVNGQQPPSAKNDVTTPLHAMKVDYPVPYEAPSKENVKAVIDRIFNYLDATTPAQMMNKQSGEILNYIDQLDTNTIIRQGDFRLTSYEWGVTYSAMQRATETTGDKKYADYVKTRFDFLAKWILAVKSKFPLDYIQKRRLFNQPIDPHALDDAGAVCASMIKAQRSGLSNDLRPLIDNYIKYIFTKEYRLKDGTIGRNRPQKNTLWLDDLFMYIPSVAQMGKLTGDKKYFDDAVKQVLNYSKRMFNKEKGLYMHGWVESMEVHPQFHWGRANGWALLAMSELLDVLPENHAGRNAVLQQFKDLVKGLASYQSGSGFWHQLLDRNDSYLETSATAIYSYCIAHACNKGWIDAMAYGPMSILAWNAVSTKINDKGQVEGTCVGTGMAFDPAFYYYRPVNVFAAHGYGPAILAGAEIFGLLSNFSFDINDSALQLKEKNK